MNRPMPPGIPLRPDFDALRERNVRAFFRSCTALVLAAHGHKSAEAFAAERWPSDREALALTKAAVTPLNLSTAPPEIARTLISDLLPLLAPVSAASRLFGSALSLSFERSAKIVLPYFAVDASAAGWVEELKQIPVTALMLSPGATVLPHKIAAISSFTREMSESSNIEALVTNALTRAIGLQLDASLFDANPATVARPPGLRNGIAGLTGSAATDPFTAMTADLAALAAAVSPVADAGGIAYIVSAAKAGTIRSRSYAAPLIYSTSQLATNIVVAVALNALVSAGGTDPPEVDTSKETLLYEDNAPAAPSEGTLSWPTKSLFQTDSVAVRLRLPVSWALRDARGAAWLTATGW